MSVLAERSQNHQSFQQGSIHPSPYLDLLASLGRIAARSHRRRSGRLPDPPWTATSAEDAVAVAPSDEDVYRPDPRPIHAGCPLEEGPPETLHRSGVEAGRSDGLRVPEGLVHDILQAAPDPPIERQNEPALG